jgi:hypothetical protein
MKSLFDQSTYQDTLLRMDKLTAKTQGLWGKMSVAQMLAHVNEAFGVPLQEKKFPRMFIGRLVGGMLKKKLFDESPIKKNLPTAPGFLIKDDKNFDSEKQKILTRLEKFHQKKENGIGSVVHPFFGTLTGEEWGMGMYKHLSYHLEQFGV